MSRELEFRRWSHSHNCMAYSSEMSGGLEQFFSNTGGESVSSDMQFTGLLDSNGKKIFEGDVLMSKCGEKAFVYFFDGAFMVRIGKYYPVKTHQSYMKDNQFKVIGNIHEAKL